jgi:hypothetical protein
VRSQKSVWVLGEDKEFAEKVIEHVDCPACNAKTGDRCRLIYREGIAQAPHAARIRSYQSWQEEHD